MLWTSICVCCCVTLVGICSWRLLALRSFAREAAPRWCRSLEPAATAGAERSEADARAAIAELNEATLDFQARVDQPAMVPRACAKIAFLLGAWIALMQAMAGMGQVRDQAWLQPLISFLGGCSSALGCSIIGRLAEDEARRLREQWSALIRRSA
jgi:hypothetical protein